MILRLTLMAFVLCQTVFAHYRRYSDHYKTHSSGNQPHITNSKRCHSSCYIYPSIGRCLPDGRCLCAWGWTGPNSVYSTKPGYLNRIKADYCAIPCTYTMHFRNTDCLLSTKPTPTTTPKAIVQKCNIKCEAGGRGLYGYCLGNGKCLCRWGCTGPNAAYVVRGSLRNRIVADYCLISCEYNYYNPNPYCAHIANPNPTTKPTTPATTTTTTTTRPTSGQCNPLCKNTGQCLTNGRCLCQWKYTGPNSAFITRGYFKNRIVADYCTVKCYYSYLIPIKNCIINGQTMTTTSTTKAKPTCKLNFLASLVLKLKLFCFLFLLLLPLLSDPQVLQVLIKHK